MNRHAPGSPTPGHEMSCSIVSKTELPFDDAVEKVTEELAREEFGVLLRKAVRRV